ncbi:MAG: hypothetical protein K2N63_11225 [Lachnospiraceae bacterium]|nr:hypothetical protein [Lachnospiraceae bacterium]
MKKNIIIIASMLTCVATIIACILISNPRRVTYNTVAAERIVLAENFETLEEESDLIVRVRVLEGKENVLVEAPGNQGGVLYGYTLTKLDVLDVLKGNPVSEPISITEEYYTTKDMGGTIIWTQGNYLPAKEGGEYIFFLKAYEPGSKYEGLYFPVDLERGKYVTELPTLYSAESNNISAKVLELKSDENIMEYWKWYEQVAEKYMK